MRLPTLKQFREEGLANMTGTTDLSGHETDLVNSLVELLRKSYDKLRPALMKMAHSGDLDSETEGDLKQIMGLIANLKDKPQKEKKLRDPMSNVVARPFSGPDGPGNGVGGGEG